MHAWSDPLATWEHDAGLKIPAGVDVELMFTEGALLLDRVAADLDALDAPAEAEVVEGGGVGGPRHRRARSRPGWPRCSPPSS